MVISCGVKGTTICLAGFHGLSVFEQMAPHSSLVHVCGHIFLFDQYMSFAGALLYGFVILCNSRGVNVTGSPFYNI